MDKKTLAEEDILFVRGICKKSFRNNRELGNDCFLYAYEKLCEDGYRRVRAFKGESSFRTYLYSVTTKLIIDFRRSRFGYKVLPKFYWEFDERDRRIFKLFYYQNLSPDQVENAILADFEISREQAERRVDAVRKRIMESKVEMDNPAGKRAIPLGEEIETFASQDKGADPEESVIKVESEQRKEKVLNVLKEEIGKLDDEDILILQLYFEQDMTAKEVAASIPGLSYRRVYKRVERLLGRLRKNLRKRGVDERAIEDIFQRL